MAGRSSSNPVANPNSWAASTASSSWPRRRFWMKACPRITTLAVGWGCSPRIGLSVPSAGHGRTRPLLGLHSVPTKAGPYLNAARPPVRLIAVAHCLTTRHPHCSLPSDARFAAPFSLPQQGCLRTASRSGQLTPDSQNNLHAWPGAHLFTRPRLNAVAFVHARPDASARP